MHSETIVRTTLWLSLGAWIGSWGFFAFVVSRVAFQVLPGDVAGNLAGDLLRILHFGGAGLAIVAAGCAFMLGRKGWLVGLPMALALICLVSELWITPEIAAVRPSAMAEASTAAAADRFRMLHQLSIGLFLAIHLASIVLLGLHARLDTQTSQANL